MKQQQNSHIGIIYVTYPSYPQGVQRGTDTITHLREVYRPFTLTNFQIYQIRYAKGKAINANR